MLVCAGAVGDTYNAFLNSCMPNTRRVEQPHHTTELSAQILVILPALDRNNSLCHPGMHGTARFFAAMQRFRPLFKVRLLIFCVISWPNDNHHGHPAEHHLTSHHKWLHCSANPCARNSPYGCWTERFVHDSHVPLSHTLYTQGVGSRIFFPLEVSC
jgi:hypothetical protein